MAAFIAVKNQANQGGVVYTEKKRHYLRQKEKHDNPVVVVIEPCTLTAKGDTVTPSDVSGARENPNRFAFVLRFYFRVKITAISSDLQNELIHSGVLKSGNGKQFSLLSLVTSTRTHTIMKSSSMDPRTFISAGAMVCIQHNKPLAWFKLKT